MDARSDNDPDLSEVVVRWSSIRPPMMIMSPLPLITSEAAFEKDNWIALWSEKCNFKFSFFYTDLFPRRAHIAVVAPLVGLGVVRDAVPPHCPVVVPSAT